MSSPDPERPRDAPFPRKRSPGHAGHPSGATDAPVRAPRPLRAPAPDRSEPDAPERGDGDVDERRRISRFLHDEVQQLLYGIRLKTSIIRGKLGPEATEALGDDLDEVDEWAVEAIEALQDLCARLSPEADT